jgi:hypothetical protein
MGVFFGSDMQSIGHFVGFTQQTNGAVTTIGSASLGAPATVRDIGGDATYAIGRWAAGSVSGLQNPVTLTDSSSASYHYVLFNQATSLPTEGTLTCNNGALTTPTYVGGASVAPPDFKGTVEADASLSFSSAGAAVKVDLSLRSTTSAGVGVFSTTVPAGKTVITGSGVLNVGNSLYITVGAAAQGYDLIGGYFLNTQSGARYVGAYRFHCQ